MFAHECFWLPLNLHLNTCLEGWSFSQWWSDSMATFKHLAKPSVILSATRLFIMACIGYILFLCTTLTSSLMTCVSEIWTNWQHIKLKATIPRVSHWHTNLKINQPTGNMHPQLESKKLETRFWCSTWAAPDCGAVGCPRDLATATKSRLNPHFLLLPQDWAYFQILTE